jgi:hypothetical protein
VEIQSTHSTTRISINLPTRLRYVLLVEIQNTGSWTDVGTGEGAVTSGGVPASHVEITGFPGRTVRE